MTYQEAETWCECGEYRIEPGHALCPGCQEAA